MALKTTIKVLINALNTKALDLDTTEDELAYSKTNVLNDGTGSGAADKLFHDQRTLLTGANENLDLAGVLADAFGGTLTFAKIKAILVRAADANTTELTVKSDGAAGVPMFAALGDGIKVPPGGTFLWTAPQGGIVVTAATGDLLNVANAAGASAIYDIIVVGTSA